MSKSQYKRLAIQSEKTNLEINVCEEVLADMDDMCEKFNIDYEELLELLVVLAKSSLSVLKN